MVEWCYYRYWCHIFYFFHFMHFLFCYCTDHCTFCMLHGSRKEKQTIGHVRVFVFVSIVFFEFSLCLTSGQCKRKRNKKNGKSTSSIFIVQTLYTNVNYFLLLLEMLNTLSRCTQSSFIFLSQPTYHRVRGPFSQGHFSASTVELCRLAAEFRLILRNNINIWRDNRRK